MKGIKILLIMITCFVFQGMVAQVDTTANNKIESQIENYLSDKEYTRIPNKDFDRILQNTVDEEVKARLMFWLTLISIIIAVFGGVGAIAFNLKIKQVVQTELEKKNDELLANIDKMVRESKLNKLAVDLESLIEKSKTNTKIEQVKTEAHRLLGEAKELGHTNLIPKIIDVMVGVLFSQRNIEELDELIETHEKEFQLNARTYASAAILNMDSYELDGVKKHKENCIKYGKASINQNIYYGDPRGTLILLHAIDFSKSESPEEKEKEKGKVKNIIAEILKGTSGYIASNTCKRLKRDGKVPAFSKYILAIEAALEEDFKKLYDKAASYEQRANLSKSTK